ncbi:MAG TPA: SDR family NAD(P)-dependent oxidoreductase, partial [Casimicrobiaceae bacterium]|nr:SDR family NAD(P)-dependent oxidoreductase [Casimicrobiaceae bacterium]
MDLGHADRVVVVAGASKGIGYACAAAFAAEGAKLAMISR